jgi:hypothetical protein
MALLNYTTTISPEKTASEIHGILVKHGAKSIQTDYKDGKPDAIAFLVNTQAGDTPVRLPVNIEAVFQILKKQKLSSRTYRYSNLTKEQEAALREQAYRVGWRIIKDWIEAQMAILETEMVKLDQIFLPYIETPKGTVYQLYQNMHLQLTQGQK